MAPRRANNSLLSWWSRHDVWASLSCQIIILYTGRKYRSSPDVTSYIHNTRTNAHVYSFLKCSSTHNTQQLRLLCPVAFFHGLKSDLFRSVNGDGFMMQEDSRSRIDGEFLTFTFLCDSISFLTSGGFRLLRIKSYWS